MMIRDVRWQIWLPRLVLVAVVLLAAQYVLGLAGRRAVVRALESYTGARVQLTHARVSLFQRKLVLNDLRVAGPLQHDGSVVEADHCELDVAALPLLRKQLVIRHAALSGLRFGTAGERSGAPPNSASAASPATKRPIDVAADAAQRQLEEIAQRIEFDYTPQLPSVRRAAALGENWRHRSAALDEQVRQLHRQSEELLISRGTVVNPLRHADRREETSVQVAELRSEHERLTAELAALPSLIEEERRAIVAARRLDKSFLHDQLQMPTIDADALAAYLLRDHAARSVSELVGWLQSIRRLVPPAQARSAPGRSGEEILFAGGRSASPLLIRQLALRGTARIGGRAVDVRGTLTDLASAPAKHDKPLSLRLETAGSPPLVVAATIDRTTPVPRDVVCLESSGGPLPEVLLGSDVLGFTVQSSPGALSINAVLEGQRLTGEMELAQTQARIVPDTRGALHDSLGATLRRACRGVDQTSLRIVLRGTLDRPEFSFSSNIGSLIADALNQTLQSAGEKRGSQLLARSEQHVDAQLAEVDRQLAQIRDRLSPQLVETADRIRKIDDEQSPPSRISSEHLGRRLPANSLFR